MIELSGLIFAVCLRSWGFPSLWINLVMASVSCVTYSFIVNRSPRGYIHLPRGLRQGDPFSPYPFMLCADGLSALIARRERLYLFQCLTICPGAPSISHLLFADDNFLFIHTKLSNCTQITDILCVYERVSGQKVNLHKSEVCFSKNIKRPERVRLASVLRVNWVNIHERYLGFPTII